MGAKDGYGNTPLMHWVLCSEEADDAEQLVQALCKAGAPVNERNAEGWVLRAAGLPGLLMAPAAGPGPSGTRRAH